MDELRNVILHVLDRAGPRGLNRTLLVKLVYFAELESWQRYGAPLTGTPFYSYHYGAYAPEVIYVAEEVPDLIRHSRFQGFDKPEHRYELQKTAEFPTLSPEAREIISDVFGRIGRLSAYQVGRLSKETAPMQQSEKGVRLDLSVVAPVRARLRVSSPRLLAAAERLDTSVRGTTEDLAEEDRQQLAAMAPYRERVTPYLDEPGA
jgi:uncharacterized phage-associated protein